MKQWEFLNNMLYYKLRKRHKNSNKTFGVKEKHQDLQQMPWSAL
jgi:hypothetical protein